MVGLIAHGIGTRQRDGPQDFAIVWRVAVEVDDGDEVRGDMGLVSRPDEQSILRLVRKREGRSHKQTKQRGAVYHRSDATACSLHCLSRHREAPFGSK